MMRVQIYTNDREQPIDLEVLEMRTQAREITTNENGQRRGASIDQTGGKGRSTSTPRRLRRSSLLGPACLV
jgi:hypothetical protein